VSAPTPGAPRQRTALLTFAAAVALTAWAPLLVVHGAGLLGIFQQLAADAFYHLAVAERSAEAGFFTLDGVHPVNGFNPLFQSALRVAFQLLDPGPADQAILCFAWGLVFTAIGTGLFALAILHGTGSPSLALLAAVPGFYHWLAPTAHPEVGAQWSFVNGMESPFAILFFGIAAYLLLARRWLEGALRPAQWLALSLLFTLLTLTRLDDALIFVPFAAWAIWTAAARREAWLRLVWLGAIPGVAVGGYLLFNLSYAGSALPLSGVAKAGGPTEGVLRNAYAVVTMFVPFADIRGFDLDVWSREQWRVLQMGLPALAAAAALLAWRPRGDTLPRGERLVLCLLSGYVLLRAGYNFLFVGLWHQGHWYYPLPIMIFNALVAVCVGDVLRRAGVRRPAWAAPAWCALLLLAATAYASGQLAGQRHRENHVLFENASEIERVLEVRCPGCRLLSFDDGILAWSLSIPTMNGLGLMLDREAYDAREEGRLLEVAHARGHRLIATLNYPIAADLDADNAAARLAEYPFLRGEDFEAWRFEWIHRDPESGAVFIAFEPRAGATR